MKNNGQLTPEYLRPYYSHLRSLPTFSPSLKEIHCECPFCGSDKYSISSSTGLSHCKVASCRANKGMNSLSFLRTLHEASLDAQKDLEPLEELAEDRGLLSADTLIRWGVCKSISSGTWIIPGWGTDGKIHQLYRYSQVRTNKGPKYRLLPTAGLPQQLFKPATYNDKADTIYICEGPWDGMILWELLEYLGTKAEVVAVPGAGTFNESWYKVFAKKRVVLLYDSDHPNKNTGLSAGRVGMERTSRLLWNSRKKPKSITYLAWGGEGFDKDKPDGYDIRDYFSSGSDLAKRKALVKPLLDMTKPIPEEWKESEDADIGVRPCNSWEELTAVWKEAMSWVEGLDRALSVMLASVVSTTMAGDQLWVKVMGPAACGKSTLCEALSICKKYILAKSTIRGFHSGWKTGSDGDDDHSLLAICKDKTLVIKDGDTLLQAPNLTQILAEGRDVYDRVSRAHFRNQIARDYEDHSMTLILCGTGSLRAIDSSELGERFVDCVIYDSIDENLEDEVGKLVAMNAFSSVRIPFGLKADSEKDTTENPAEDSEGKKTLAKQMTGGYVQYLRENAHLILPSIKVSDENLDKCRMYAKFVAIMRARPSTRQEEKAEREMSFRLIGQLVRLASCLAAVLNRQEVDSEVMRRVKAVAMDSARGRTLTIANKLLEAGGQGLSITSLSLRIGQPEAKVSELCRFLRELGVLVRIKTKSGQNRYCLAPKFSRLLKSVIDEPKKLKIKFTRRGR